MEESGRDVRMTALLVEQNAKAHARLATIQPKYPDIAIKTYPADFISVVPAIVERHPA